MLFFQFMKINKNQGGAEAPQSPLPVSMGLYISVHHVPKCMSCHKAIVVITGRAHCFHDNIYNDIIILFSYEDEDKLKITLSGLCLSLKILFEEIFKRYFKSEKSKNLLKISSNNIFSEDEDVIKFSNLYQCIVN